MNTIVQITDLKPGDYVTVLGWINPLLDAKPRAEIPRYDKTKVDYVGNVLRIESIDTPFMVVSRCYNRRARDVVTLDSRAVDLVRLSDEYVKQATDLDVK